MIIDFDNSKDKKSVNEAGIQTGDFETMTKLRKKQLPKIQKNIQEVLKDYNGESITIIIQNEDENGMPSNVRVLMAGVSRMESQLGMSKALDKASNKAVEVLLECAKGDTRALLQIGKALMGSIVDEMEDK